MLKSVKTRQQIIKITALLSLAVILASLSLTLLFQYFTGNAPNYLGLLPSIIAPILIAPPIIYKFLDIIRQLHLAHELLQSMSQEDYLTGVFNRRHLEETATKEFSLGKRHNFPVSIMIMDIDHFKNINDTFGHLKGDDVLVELTQCVYEIIRKTDIFGRYGGEEFILFMPHTALDDAVMLAERIRQAVADRNFLPESLQLGVTISLGVAGVSPETNSLEALILNADLALYRAKQAGRNRVSVYDGPG